MNAWGGGWKKKHKPNQKQTKKKHTRKPNLIQEFLVDTWNFFFFFFFLLLVAPASGCQSKHVACSVSGVSVLEVCDKKSGRKIVFSLGNCIFCYHVSCELNEWSNTWLVNNTPTFSMFWLFSRKYNWAKQQHFALGKVRSSIYQDMLFLWVFMVENLLFHRGSVCKVKLACQVNPDSTPGIHRSWA